MAFANPNKHSWKEYRYKFANDNCEPKRMWVRDEDRIFEVDINTYMTANNTAWHEDKYMTFEEAEKVFEQAND